VHRFLPPSVLRKQMGRHSAAVYLAEIMLSRLVTEVGRSATVGRSNRFPEGELPGERQRRPGDPPFKTEAEPLQLGEPAVVASVVALIILRALD
jgi:hypothetical protein